ncbi:MAG TPA: hypothetical protein VF763_14390 [Candidatus Limnocylindrales bacterium]
MPTPVVTVRDWGDAIFLSLTTALDDLLKAIPLIIGALVILIIGWLISNVLASLTATVLRRVGADRLYANHGPSVYGDAAQSWPPSRMGAELVRWLVRLFVLVAAANTLGWAELSTLLNAIILWIPNLIVAAVILLVAPLIARFVGGLISTGASDMGFTNGALLGRIANVAIVAFAVLLAVNQLGIAQNLIDILFIGLVGAVSLALGLAFGLGGRDVAAQLTQEWYQASQSKAGQVSQRMGNVAPMQTRMGGSRATARPK